MSLLTCCHPLSFVCCVNWWWTGSVGNRPFLFLLVCLSSREWQIFGFEFWGWFAVVWLLFLMYWFGYVATKSRADIKKEDNLSCFFSFRKRNLKHKTALSGTATKCLTTPFRKQSKNLSPVFACLSSQRDIFSLETCLSNLFGTEQQDRKLIRKNRETHVHPHRKKKVLSS